MKLKRHIRYEPIASKSILNPVKARSMPFEWSINPYRGCMHGCSFCYARSTHSFLGEQADDTFQNHIFVKANAPEVLRAELQQIAGSRKGIASLGRVAIGTATDPYQPREGTEALTRGCLEVLADYQVPTTVTTRSPLILRDIDLLRKIPVISINLSINTLNRNVWKAFEPSTPIPDKRFETVRHLVEEGIPAGIFLAPILPFISDHPAELAAIMEKASNSKARFVMPSVLRLSKPEVKVWFFRALREYDERLAEKYGSMYHGSGSAPAEYRSRIKETVRELMTRYGLKDIADEHAYSFVPAQARQAVETGPEQLCLF